MTSNMKEKIVSEILKTPIIASTTYFKNPCLVSDLGSSKYIISGQMYKQCSDEDMCDFAIGYYNVIYGKNILENSNITKMFAGDTMIDHLKRALNNYHCLANFWILPMGVGRSCGKLNRSKLSVGLFLNKLAEHYEDYKEEYTDYFNEFTKDVFSQKHYLNDSFLVDNKVVDIIDADVAELCISKRAKNLSEKKREELYTYFIDTFGENAVDSFTDNL